MTTYGGKPTMTITEDDLRWWLDLVPTLDWRFARTMADMPHSYVVLGDSNGLSKEDYARAARVIRTFGVTEMFHTHPNIYLPTADRTKKMWVPWGPAEEDLVDLINIADVDQHFGVGNTIDSTEQPVTRHTKYDTLATEYDAMWKSDDDIADEKAITRILREKFPDRAPLTLDVGCGTGLLLELGPVSKRLYVGIDPSTAMLNQLLLKHAHPAPSKVIAGAVGDLSDETLIEAAKEVGKKSQYDLVIGMFAVGSYLEPLEFVRLKPLVAARGMLLVMFYEAGYLPEYYEEGDPLPPFDHHKQMARQFAKEGLPGHRWTKIGTFDTLIWER